nr:DUF4760 domain-containing protein [Cognatishimia sp. F0-27]
MSCEEIDGAAQVICAAPNTYWWVAPAVIACSAVMAALISLRAIAANKEIARKRATLDLIERSESTEYYQSLHRAFTAVRRDEGGLAQLKVVTNPDLMLQRQRVLNFLNHYEIIAIGIKKGVLDEDLYRSFMRSTVVRDWFEAEDFIAHIRRPTPDSGSKVSANKAFSNFEELALKWAPEVQLDLPLEGQSDGADDPKNKSLDRG